MITSKEKKKKFYIILIIIVLLIFLCVFFTLNFFSRNVSSKQKNSSLGCMQPYNITSCEDEGRYNKAHSGTIKEIQTLLKNAEYYSEPVNGNYDNNTYNAVKLAQKAYGLQQTGKVDYEFVEKIASEYNFRWTIITYDKNGGEGSISGTKNNRQFVLNANVPISISKLSKNSSTHVGWIASSISRENGTIYYYGCSKKSCTKPVMYTASQKDSLGTSFVPYVFSFGETVNSDIFNSLDNVNVTFRAYYCGSYGSSYDKAISSCEKDSNIGTNDLSNVTKFECIYDNQAILDNFVPASTTVLCSLSNLPAGVTNAKWYYNGHYKELTNLKSNNISWSFVTPSELYSSLVTINAELSNKIIYSKKIKVAKKVTAVPELNCYYNNQNILNKVIPPLSKISCNLDNIPSGIGSVSWYYNDKYIDVTKRNENSSILEFSIPKDLNNATLIIKAALQDKNIYTTTVKIGTESTLEEDNINPLISDISFTPSGIYVKASDNVKINKICLDNKTNCIVVNSTSINSNYSFSDLDVRKSYTLFVCDSSFNCSSKSVGYIDKTNPVISSAVLSQDGLTINAYDDVLISKICLGSKSECNKVNLKNVNKTFPFTTVDGGTYTVYVYDSSGNFTTKNVLRPDRIKPVIKKVTLTSSKLTISASDNIKISRICIDSSKNCKYVNSKIINSSFIFSGLKKGKTYSIYVYDSSENYITARIVAKK